jgi:hypothetical protein
LSRVRRSHKFASSDCFKLRFLFSTVSTYLLSTHTLFPLVKVTALGVQYTCIDDYVLIFLITAILRENITVLTVLVD